MRYLITLKQSHSKVMKIEHKNLMIKDYLLPNINKISKEEIQLIFRLRCKLTNVKMNMNGMYDQFQCQICEKEEESQIHIYECNKIWEIRNMNMSNKPKYEMIENGNLKQKLMVAKIFYENYNILESYRHKR